MGDKASAMVGRVRGNLGEVWDEMVKRHLVLNLAGIANGFAAKHLFDAMAVAPGVEPRVMAAVEVCCERSIQRFFCLGNNRQEQERGELFDAFKIGELFDEALGRISTDESESGWRPQIEAKVDGPNCWEQGKNLIVCCRETHARTVALVAGAWHTPRAWLTCVKCLLTEWRSDDGDMPLVLPYLVNVGVCGEFVRGATALHQQDGYKPGAFGDIVAAEVERCIRYEGNVASVEDVMAYLSQPHFEGRFTP